VIEKKWLLDITPKAEKDIKGLPQKDADSVLDKLADLLFVDNPLIVPGIKKVKESNNLWRARQGNYRILFTLDSTPVTRDGVTYKGTLIVANVRKRDESTYR
jgi:mRNA-degrading endonuclease RelE of RelBE toxin-antitoxin system